MFKLCNCIEDNLNKASFVLLLIIWLTKLARDIYAIYHAFVTCWTSTSRFMYKNLHSKSISNGYYIIGKIIRLSSKNNEISQF